MATVFDGDIFDTVSATLDLMLSEHRVMWASQGLMKDPTSNREKDAGRRGRVERALVPELNMQLRKQAAPTRPCVNMDGVLGMVGIMIIETYVHIFVVNLIV